MRPLATILLIAVLAGCRSDEGEHVRIERVPDGGIQPQVVVDGRTVHLIYFAGEAKAGDVFYVRRRLGADEWSAPIRVNDVPGSAVAVGNVRGAHVAVGMEGRVHVAWMGSQESTPRGPGGASPMLYARLTDDGTAFEPQRNVLQHAVGLDGGGSVAADGLGNVYVAWHGEGDEEGEAGRRVWVAQSEDGGDTFARERPAYGPDTGACACCGMRAFAENRTLHLLYRAAEESIHRGMQLVQTSELESTGQRLDEWLLSSCPMSTASIHEAGSRILAAWENDGQIFHADLVAPVPTAAPGDGAGRKHPVAVGNDRGETLLVWTEGMGWNQGGTLAWHMLDPEGAPTDVRGVAPGVPVWSVPAAYADDDGDFIVLY